MTRSSTKPLPECRGPKLQPFQDPKAAVELKKLVSESHPTDLSAGGHSHVFEATIQSKTYALKIFKYYDDSDDLAALSVRQREVFSIDMIHGHMDPFFNECRAYGRLIERGINGKVAVRCYGYLMLPATREEELEHRFGVTAWNRPYEEYSKPASRRQPFRAIVKDLVTEDVPLTVKSAKRMLTDLRRIRRQNVYNMDICARNYKGGKLIDFSVAMTRPHYLLVIKPPWRRELYKYNDLTCFDHMLDEAGIVTWDRATPNQESIQRLRPRDDTGRMIKNL